MIRFHIRHLCALSWVTALVLTTGSHDFVDSPHGITNQSNSSPLFLSDLITQHVTSWGAKTLVLISDDVYFRRVIHDLMNLLNVTLICHDGKSQGFNAWLRAVYTSLPVKYFLLASPHPGRILQQAEAVFVQEAFGPLAAFPHRTRWLVIAWTDRQARQVARQQFRSVLDNVAVIQVKYDEISPSVEIRCAMTFMWRENRTREAAPVSMTETSSCSDGCHQLFPNVKFHFNGRTLRVVAKEYLALHLTQKLSPRTGRVEASGFLIDVLDYSAEALNFSYEIVTKKNTNGNYNIDWYDYAYQVENGTVDIGLSAWSNLYRTMYPKMSFSYPVMTEKIVGVYKRPPRRTFKDSLLLLCPFSIDIYVYLLLCLFYTTTFYLFVVRFVYVSDSSDCVKEDFPCSGYLASTGADLRVRGQAMESLTKKSWSYLCVLSQFFVAILNQAYLPQPRQMSARIVTGVWAIGLVFFYALFSSAITAQMVGRKDSLPFNTFDELLRRDDYKCSALKDSLVGDLILEAKDGPLAAMRSKLQLVEVPANGIVDEAGEAYLVNMDYNTVFVFMDSVVRDWTDHAPRDMQFVIMEDHPLFYTGLCIVFAVNSELDAYISTSFLQLQESGIQSTLIRSNSDHQHAAPRVEVKKSGPYSLERMFWVFTSCAIALAVCGIVLALEIHVYRRAADKKADGVKPGAVRSGGLVW